MELVAQPSGSDHTQATVQEAVSDFRDVAKTLCPPDWPRTLEDYTDPEVDEPLLGLHVLSFTDSTVVVLTYLHVLMDGGGIKSCKLLLLSCMVYVFYQGLVGPKQRSGIVKVPGHVVDRWRLSQSLGLHAWPNTNMTSKYARPGPRC